MPSVTTPDVIRVKPSAADWQNSGIAHELLASLNRATGVGLHSLAIAQSRPPHFVCANAAGTLVALNVDAVACNQAAPTTHGDPLTRVLHAGALAANIAGLLAEKDREPYESGPYSEVVAVLVIGEPTLTFEQAVFELTSITFGPYRQLTSAYVLLPYDSSTMSCPAVPIQLRR